MISRSFPSVVRPDRAQIHGWGAAGSKPVLLLSSKVIDDRTIPKKKQRLGCFQNVQRYAPWGAYLTLSFRKRCSGTPPGGVTLLHLSLNWGLTDRQVSLPPFRALLRSGGPELSKLGQHGTFGSWLLPAPSFVGSWLPPTPSFVGSCLPPAPSFVFSWGAGFRQLLSVFSWGSWLLPTPAQTLLRPGPSLPPWVTQDFRVFVWELASANSRPDAFASGALATPLGNSGLSCFRVSFTCGVGFRQPLRALRKNKVLLSTCPDLSRRCHTAFQNLGLSTN